MRRSRPLLCCLSTALVLSASAAGQHAAVTTTGAPAGGIAFASFGPMNTDIFLAAADGSNPRSIASGPALDYGASFSADGAWIVFTSTRQGSADIYRVRKDGSGLEQLTRDAAFDDQGVMSPDGTSLAFVSSRTGQADIWLLEIATGRLRNLTDHPGGDFRPAWSADGKWLAFSSDRDSKRPLVGFVTGHSTEIYVVRADGSALRAITQRGAFAGSPAWSADGRRLTYYEAEIDQVQKIRSPRRERGTTHIVTVDVQTGERHVVTQGAGEKWSPHWIADGRIGYVSGGPEGGVEFTTGSPGARGEMRSPSWSPDGPQMVFHRDAGGAWPPLVDAPSRDATFRLVRTGVFASYSPHGDRLVVNDEKAGILHNSLVVMQADGSGRSIVFTDPARSALAPAWSPDGGRVAVGLGAFFQRTMGASTADIAVMNVDGSGVRILTDGKANYGLPSWSPDGRQLVYRLAGKDRNGLIIMDVATGAVRTLTEGTAHDNFPSWSPKGDRIAFTSDRDGDYEIYTVRPDGTDLRRLTHTAGNDAHNSWSRDGEWIVFTSARGGFKDESALHPFNPQPYGDLYVMRPDGSDVRMLTDDQFEDGTPTWVPAPRTR